MKPTLADVARLAGVSTATVSRCLNAPDRVVEATRARVLAAVAELGYAPDFGGRVLAAGRTQTIGVVIPTMENAIFAQGIQAFQEELGRRGYTLLIASSAYDARLEAEQIRNLAARGSDGLLLIGHDRDPAVYDALAGRGIPVLVAWAFDRAAPRPAVGFDNATAMARLASEVLARGHRRIGYVTARIAENDRARARLAGIRAAMAEADLAAEALEVVETAYGFDEGSSAFAALMGGPRPPTAVMCGNDVLAVGALRAARRMGLSVPGDVSVTGFDDIEVATVVDPPLTTVHVPHRAMGRAAAACLVEMVRGEARPPPGIELAVELRLRDTLGPPPGG